MHTASASRFLFSTFLVLVAAIAHGDILRVDDDSIAVTPDGSTWDNAFLDIDDALAVAQSGDELWVAYGVYVPPNGSGYATVAGVNIFGGFAGTEASRDDRPLPRSDPDRESLIDGSFTYRCFVITHPITLDGFSLARGSSAIGGNVLIIAEATIRNCYIRYGSALTGGLLTVADGITATVEDCVLVGGEALSGQSSGGAISVENGATLVVRDTQLLDGIASLGGAAFVDAGCSLVVERCVFTHATALLDGGAIWTGAGASVTVSDSVFTQCAAANGGAIFSNSGSGTYSLSDTQFTANRAQNSGGAIYTATPFESITGCSFEGNTANASSPGGGGAVWMSNAATPFTSCTFKGNNAASRGGAIVSLNCASTFSRCRFESNQIAAGNQGVGGAVYASGLTPAFEDSQFAGNSSAYRGGAIMVESGGITALRSTFVDNRSAHGGAIVSSTGTVALTNCLLARNSAASGGGAIALESAGSLNTVFCTFVDNTAAVAASDITRYGGTIPVVIRSSVFAPGTARPFILPAGSVTATTSNLPGGAAVWGAGNIDADPMFYNGDSGDYRLLPGSPSVNTAGNPGAGTDFDLRGLPRNVNGFDMGAFETQAIEDQDGDGLNDDIEGNGDPDGDGIPNFLDTDSDGDGLGDGLEDTIGLDPYDADSDNDGTNDGEQLAAGGVLGDINGDGEVNAVDVQLVINAALGIMISL